MLVIAAVQGMSGATAGRHGAGGLGPGPSPWGLPGASDGTVRAWREPQAGRLAHLCRKNFDVSSAFGAQFLQKGARWWRRR